LLVYQKAGNKFYHYDSLAGNLPCARTIAQNLGELFSIDGIKVEQMETPRQNPHRGDCGAYVLAITELLTEKYTENDPATMEFAISDAEAEQIKYSAIAEIRAHEVIREIGEGTFGNNEAEGEDYVFSESGMIKFKEALANPITPLQIHLRPYLKELLEKDELDRLIRKLYDIGNQNG